MRGSLYQEQMVLVDGYTLVIGEHEGDVIFLGRHSRQFCSIYNDAWLIQILANQTLEAEYQDFWYCLEQHEPGHPIAYDAFGRSFETELWPITITEADDYRNWSLWELIDYQRQQQGEGFDELIWRWVPGSYYPDYFMVHSTVLKIVQVARSWVEHRRIPELGGVEVITEADWTARFGTHTPSNHKFSALRHSRHSLLIPPILQDLEQTATDYLELFADRARLYEPQNAVYQRDKLLSGLNIAGLIDRLFSEELQDQLVDYPQIQHCLMMLDRFQKILNQHCLHQSKPLLTLDWLFFATIWPQIDGILDMAVQTIQQAKLTRPHSLSLVVDGQSYQLITTKAIEHSAIQLAAAIPMDQPVDLTDRWADGRPPSYLELLTWAALPDCRWSLELGAIDWAGREQDLISLGSDPSLPQTEQLLACLSRHLGRLWTMGDFVAFDRVVGMLNLETPAVQILRSRCIQLRSGQRNFNYAEW